MENFIFCAVNPIKYLLWTFIAANYFCKSLIVDVWHCPICACASVAAHVRFDFKFGKPDMEGSDYFLCEPHPVGKTSTFK